MNKFTVIAVVVIVAFGGTLFWLLDDGPEEANRTRPQYPTSKTFKGDSLNNSAKSIPTGSIPTGTIDLKINAEESRGDSENEELNEEAIREARLEFSELVHDGRIIPYERDPPPGFHYRPDCCSPYEPSRRVYMITGTLLSADGMPLARREMSLRFVCSYYLVKAGVKYNWLWFVRGGPLYHPIGDRRIENMQSEYEVVDMNGKPAYEQGDSKERVIIVWCNRESAWTNQEGKFEIKNLPNCEFDIKVQIIVKDYGKEGPTDRIEHVWFKGYTPGNITLIIPFPKHQIVGN